MPQTVLRPTGTYISPLPANQEPVRKPRRLCILGSTGSIGVSALQVIAEHPGEFQILALAGARNIELLARQAREWRPPLLALLEEADRPRLLALLPSDYRPEVLVGPEGYETLAALPEADMILAAQVGAAGLRPALAAARAGKMIALANKEALVLAGELFRETCARTGAALLPVDSEHNALFQALAGHRSSDVRRIILTASGGPFRGRSHAELTNVTPADALNHPNWSMGNKISIDSATLMNKGLEVIEAYHLYGLPVERIHVVVHPQSIVHSLVEYHDGSQLAHLGQPDMRIPIAYCLAYPERLPLPLEPLDLERVGTLTFQKPDLEAFPCLALAMETLHPERGGPAQRIVLNAANEVAVAAFLEGRLDFLGIPRLVRHCLEHHDGAAPLTLEAILDIDRNARQTASAFLARQAR